MSESDRNADSLRGYYRWHAKFYDITRWAFLFGRRGLIATVADQVKKPTRILEIGCGTGKNLVALAGAFPEAKITGLDLSADMLDCARARIAPFADRIELLHRPYDGPVASEDGKFDLIVISYALSMINPGFDEVIRLCRGDLRENGVIAVVDFHETRWTWFRKWMGVNHVRMEGQILAQLDAGFEAIVRQIGEGYGGLWRYVTFVGK
jgi:S-adenosylmethionine-diacylgycerolhomoserine-N-methlytransferase